MALYKPTKGSFKKGATYSLPKPKNSSIKMPKVKSASFKVAKPAKAKTSARRVKI